MLVIPYTAEDESIHLEWSFDGDVQEYRVQTVPVPETENEEEKLKDVCTCVEAEVSLPIADYADEVYILYITAVSEDSTAVTGMQKFVLMQQENVIDENVPKTPQELADYFALTLEELADALEMSVEEYNGLNSKDVSELYLLYNATRIATYSSSSRLYLPLNGLKKSNGLSGFIPNRIIPESSNTIAHLACDYVSSTEDWRVMAIDDGEVIKVRNALTDDAGRYVIIKHEINGVSTYSEYQHLKSISVAEGTHVEAGGVIGIAGGTGIEENQYDRHLHLVIYTGNYPYKAWVKRMTSYEQNKEYDGPISYNGNTYYNPVRIFDGTALIGGSVVPSIIGNNEKTIAYENCTYKITKDVTLRKKSFDSADKGSTLKKGTTVTSVAVVDNGSNYWLELGGSYVGQYIFSGYSNKGTANGNQYLQYVSDNTTVNWNGDNISGYVHTNGESKALNGTIESNSTIKSIKAEFHKGASCWGNPVSDTVGRKNYSLYASKLDYGLAFGKLPEGNYDLVFTVEYYSNRMSTKTVEKKYPFKVTSGGSSTVFISGVSLNTSSLNLERGSSSTLTASVSPSNATNKNVNWSTSNSSVATISGGRVTAVGVGTATITCTAADGSGKKASCTVKVTEKNAGTSENTWVYKIVASWGVNMRSNAGTSYGIVTTLHVGDTMTVTKKASANGYTWGYGKSSTGYTGWIVVDNDWSQLISSTSTVPVTDLTLTLDEVSIREGETVMLTALIKPSNASNKNVSWSSSNNSVASVSGGIVKGHRGGVATITCKTADGDKTATCVVTVKTSVTGISLSQSSINLELGENTYLSATIAPSNASNKTVHWYIDDNSIASISDDGYLRTLNTGTTTITAMAEDGGYQATCRVTVTKPVVSVSFISLNKSSVSLKIGESTDLSVTILPSYASNKNVNWSTSNSSVATVSAGKVTAVGTGTAAITCTAADGSGNEANCTVTVTKPVEQVRVASIQLDNEEYVLDLAYAESYQIGATVYPNNATNKNLNYRSFDSNVASVSSSGLVVPKKNGQTTIRVTSLDNSNAYADCIITVIDSTVKVKVADPYKPTGVKLNKSGTVELNRGSELYLSTSLQPSTAKTTLTWASSNKRIATVSTNGVVSGIKEGTVTITVKTTNGKKDTVKVRIVDPYKPVSVELNWAGTVTLPINETLQLHGSVKPNTADQTLSWTSSNKKYATVSADGLVTPKRAGKTVTITAKSYNGKSSSVKVKIISVVQDRDEFKYSIGNGKCTITGYDGSATKLNVPATLHGYSVTTIGDWAFDNCNSLQSITLPDSVQSIGRGAFYKCRYLQNVSLPDSVTVIDDWTFAHCDSLVSIIIPEGVTTIGEVAFANCDRLEQVTVPASVTKIAADAFMDCPTYMIICGQYGSYAQTYAWMKGFRFTV